MSGLLAVVCFGIAAFEVVWACLLSTGRITDPPAWLPQTVRGSVLTAITGALYGVALIVPETSRWKELFIILGSLVLLWALITRRADKRARGDWW